jgi:hypothetical protein
MLKTLFVATAVVAVASLASAGITASVADYYEGPLPSAGTYVYSFDLQVTVTGNDAWTVAGGPVVGVPWITATNATFYQDPMNDTNPPNPAFFVMVPDSQYTSFYTTHLGYPSPLAPAGQPGVSPGFAFGPADTPTALNADWFWTPDGNYYPGTFTIARFTAIIDDGYDQATLDIDMLVGSLAVAPFSFEWTRVIPEPASLTLLALGGLALIRRR